jgi:EpsD family peptidyl-prolyl cis-trans isomerase
MAFRCTRLGALALAMALAGCARDEAPRPMHLAARVNNQEISVHQVQGALLRGGRAAAVDPQGATRQALESVIDQELLVQKALEARLDRDPDVMQVLENARRQILAQAWLDRTLGAAAPAQPGEVHDFYATNQALFGKRRVYALHEIVVKDPGAKLPAVESAASRARGIDELEGWLSAAGLSYVTDTTLQPAEAVPLGLLPRLMEMKDGDLALVGAGRDVTIVQLERSLEAPLTEKRATPVIEEFLMNRKRTAETLAALGKLRAQAKIEYLGDYARPPQRPAPRPAPAALPTKASLEARNDPSMQPAALRQDPPRS